HFPHAAFPEQGASMATFVFLATSRRFSPEAAKASTPSPLSNLNVTLYITSHLRDQLDFQIRICIQCSVSDDITGLDGLHQSQVIGVYDCRSHTLHHSHGNHCGIHDRTDMLGHTVGIVGKSAGGLQAHVSQVADEVQNIHLLVL